MELVRKDDMPKACVHSQSTEARCDDCFRIFGRRYAMVIIGDMVTYQLFVLVGDEVMYYVESRAQSAAVPMLLDRMAATDFLPDYPTWEARVNQHIRHETGNGELTTASFKNVDWQEQWSQHTLPRAAALAVVR